MRFQFEEFFVDGRFRGASPALGPSARSGLDLQTKYDNARAIQLVNTGAIETRVRPAVGRAMMRVLWDDMGLVWASIVAWHPFDDPETAPQELQRWATLPGACGAVHASKRA